MKKCSGGYMKQNSLMTLSCLSEKGLVSCTTSSVKFIDTKEMTFKAFWKAKLVIQNFTQHLILIINSF
jgi:hypothetical protein